MNLFLLIVRLVLGLFFPGRRDGLSLAARADGRLEQVPQSAWSRLFGELRRRLAAPEGRAARARTGGRAPARAGVPNPRPAGGS